MVMDWAILQTRTLTLLYIHRVVNPPLFCRIHMVSAAQWLTPTPAFPAQMLTGTVHIWTVLVPATTDLSNQKASQYILGSQWWLMIE